MQFIRGQLLRRTEQLAQGSKLECLVDPALVLAVGRVEVVLDAVVGAARQLFCYVSPPITHLLVQLEYLMLFRSADRVLVYVRVQVIVPST